MSQELPEGTVTVLFTDVVGSTDLTSGRGDEAAQKILRGQRELVHQQVDGATSQGRNLPEFDKLRSKRILIASRSGDRGEGAGDDRSMVPPKVSDPSSGCLKMDTTHL